MDTLKRGRIYLIALVSPCLSVHWQFNVLRSEQVISIVGIHTNIQGDLFQVTSEIFIRIFG